MQRDRLVPSRAPWADAEPQEWRHPTFSRRLHLTLRFDSSLIAVGTTKHQQLVPVSLCSFKASSGMLTCDSPLENEGENAINGISLDGAHVFSTA